jgi:hypothetical protein
VSPEGGELGRFHVHGIVLAGQSGYFKSLLQNWMGKDARLFSITITGARARVCVCACVQGHSRLRARHACLPHAHTHSFVGSLMHSPTHTCRTRTHATHATHAHMPHTHNHTHTHPLPPEDELPAATAMLQCAYSNAMPPDADAQQLLATMVLADRCAGGGGGARACMHARRGACVRAGRRPAARAGGGAGAGACTHTPPHARPRQRARHTQRPPRRATTGTSCARVWRRARRACWSWTMRPSPGPLRWPCCTCPRAWQRGRPLRRSQRCVCVCVSAWVCVARCVVRVQARVCVCVLGGGEGLSPAPCPC